MIIGPVTTGSFGGVTGGLTGGVTGGVTGVGPVAPVGVGPVAPVGVGVTGAGVLVGVAVIPNLLRSASIVLISLSFAILTGS